MLVVVSVVAVKYLLILPPGVTPPEVIVKVPKVGAVGVGNAIVLAPAVPNANVPPFVLMLPLKVKVPETVPVFAPDSNAFEERLTPLALELLMVKLAKFAVGNAVVNGNKFLNKPEPPIERLAVF